MPTILSIGGEPTVLAARRLVLQGNGYDVRAAPTLAEASEALQRGPVDCVLVSHDPPWMDGLEIVAKMGELYPKIPVVLLMASTTGMRSIAAECLSGLEGPEALLSAIRRAIDTPLASRSAQAEKRQQQRKRLDENLRTSAQRWAQFRKLREQTIETMRRILGIK